MTRIDAVLMVSYGGPRGPEDVLAFMRNATRGRGIPDERLLEVSGHYQRFGGVSPINQRNEELQSALRRALATRGLDVEVAIGNRNWTPYVHEALGELYAAGHRHITVLATAAYASYSGCRQYREDLATALARLDEAAAPGTRPSDELVLTKVGPFAERSGFVSANATALVAAFDRAGWTDRMPHLLFVTHSIPTAMADASGPGPAEGRYVAQHERVAERVAREASERLGVAVEWELVYCSRSGAPHVTWLEPDVNDRIIELATAGVQSVVTAPIGFINDHMEVVFDLDTQARETAEDLGLGYVRAATAGTDPAFVSQLAEAVLAGAPGEVAGVPTCTPDCCTSGRPGPARPAACGVEAPDPVIP